jgi:hypothetical protein
MKRWALVAAVCGVALFVGSVGQAKQLYGSDFEDTAVGSLPAGWTKVWDGTTTASVIKDPVNAGNRALTSSDLAHDASRHDVGGSVHGVGEDGWTDYIIEYDALFPVDFYMGTLFRYQDDTNFYLFDRRSGGELGNFDLWHQAGGWNRISSGPYVTDAEVWYSFRIEVEGDTFKVHIGTPDERADFGGADPLFEGTNGTLETGRFGLYGLIYIDNLVIGETEDDMTLDVDSHGKVAVTWADMKR